MDVCHCVNRARWCASVAGVLCKLEHESSEENDLTIDPHRRGGVREYVAEALDGRKPLARKVVAGSINHGKRLTAGGATGAKAKTGSD